MPSAKSTTEYFGLYNKHNIESLPKTYRGYSTEDLLKFWAEANRTGNVEFNPNKAKAMYGLLREFNLSPTMRYIHEIEEAMAAKSGEPER